jgi:hypothetical protein
MRVNQQDTQLRVKRQKLGDHHPSRLVDPGGTVRNAQLRFMAVAQREFAGNYVVLKHRNLRMCIEFCHLIDQVFWNGQGIFSARQPSCRMDGDPDTPTVRSLRKLIRKAKTTTVIDGFIGRQTWYLKSIKTTDLAARSQITTPSRQGRIHRGYLNDLKMSNTLENRLHCFVGICGPDRWKWDFGSHLTNWVVIDQVFWS